MFHPTRLTIYLTLIFIGAFNVGCSSYLMDERCEHQDWHQRGYSLAQKGKAKDQDPALRECTDFKAKINTEKFDQGYLEGLTAYCKPESAFQSGTTGSVVNFDLCLAATKKSGAPVDLPLLKSQFQKGADIFCEETNGFRVGRSGEEARKTCSKEKEAAFLKGFNKGRVVYIKERIETIKTSILSFEAQLRMDHASRNQEQTKLLILQGQPLPPQAFGPSSDTIGLDASAQTQRQSELSLQQMKVSEWDQRIFSDESSIAGLKAELLALEKELKSHLIPQIPKAN